MNRIKGARRAGQVAAAITGAVVGSLFLLFLALVYWGWVIILGAW